MSISCSCDSGEEGITGVGDPKDMVCRTPRKCQECGEPIAAGEVMYRYNMYNWDTRRTSAPHWMCESCGDLMVSVMVLGFCFYLGDIKGQWREYLEESGGV